MKRYIFGSITDENSAHPTDTHRQKGIGRFLQIFKTKTWDAIIKAGKALGASIAALFVVYLGVAMSTNLDIRLFSDPSTILSVAFKNGDIVNIDEKTFPDDSFRIYVRDIIDTDNTGGLSREEIERVEVVNIQDRDIFDLKGLELFPNIRDINCLGTQVKAIPLSELAQIERIDARNCPLDSLSLPSTARQTIKELFIGMIEPYSWSTPTFYYDPESKLIGYTTYFSEDFELDNPSFVRVVTDLPGIPTLGKETRKNGRYATEHLYIKDISSISGYESLEKLSCIGLNVSQICYCPSLKIVDARVSTIKTMFFFGCDSLESIHADRFIEFEGVAENVVIRWDRWIPSTSPGNIIDPDSSEYAFLLPYVEEAYKKGL